MRELRIEDRKESFGGARKGNLDLAHRVSSSLEPKGTEVRIICVWERNYGKFMP